MKKYLVIFSFLLILACSKDNDQNQINSFTFQGTNYELNKGLIWVADEWFKIELYSPGVNMTAGIQETEPEYSGVGEFLYFGYMIPSTSGEITNGEYTLTIPAGTYTPPSGDPGSLTFSSGIVAIGLNLSDYSGDFYNVTEGTVTLQNNDGEVVIDFDLTLTGGLEMSGNYTGTVYIWDGNLNDWR